MLPSPKSHSIVWVSAMPGSVKLPKKFITLPSSDVWSVPASTVGATLLTVFASVLTVVLSKVWELKIKNLQENRGKKEPIYEELLSFLFKIVKATKKGETVSEDEMEDFIFNFTEKVMIWGSDDVINAFYNFKKVGANTEISGNSDVKIADRKSVV